VNDFTQYHQIKNALIAAGLIDEALGMDTALNTGCDLATGLGLSGNWRGNVRHRGFDEAMRAMKTSTSNSQNATNLIHDLQRHRQSRRAGRWQERGAPRHPQCEQGQNSEP
jgi:hypothetical protein